MKTNKQNTKNVLVGIYGRSANGKVLNVFDYEYFIHIVEVTSVNTKSMYDAIHSNRKPLSIAKDLICRIVNIDLHYEDLDTVCTYKQVKDILKNEFNYNIEDLENTIISFIENERKELNN